MPPKRMAGIACAWRDAAEGEARQTAGFRCTRHVPRRGETPWSEYVTNVPSIHSPSRRPVKCVSTRSQQNASEITTVMVSALRMAILPSQSRPCGLPAHCCPSHPDVSRHAAARATWLHRDRCAQELRSAPSCRWLRTDVTRRDAPSPHAAAPRRPAHPPRCRRRWRESHARCAAARPSAAR